ncbi:hypothetical protein B0H16DRAFT_1688019 [Mycena metata]|uniref:Uncharacterized protein n=1 Tax=Mycena metata TaxID=1033252 RepID=A0AAD7JFZ8_9AGAR|nr:hypothetical protein B0H16DRAFT_1688019 [Mycena metata]
MSPEEEEQLFGSMDSDSESGADGESSSSGRNDTQASDELTVQEHLDILDDQPPISTARAEGLDLFDRAKFQSDIAAIFHPAWDSGRIQPLPHPSPSFDTVRAAPQSVPFHQSFTPVGMPTMPPYPLATFSYHQLGTLVGGNGVVRAPDPYALEGQAPSGPHLPHFRPGLSQHRPQYRQSHTIPALQSASRLHPEYHQPQARHPMLVAGHGDFQPAQPGPTQKTYGRPMAPALSREYVPATGHLHPTDYALNGALNGRLPAATPVIPLTPVLPQPSSHSDSAQLPTPYHHSPTPAQATGEIYVALPRRVLQVGSNAAPSPAGRSAGALYGSGRNNASVLPTHTTDVGPQRPDAAPLIPHVDMTQASEIVFLPPTLPRAGVRPKRGTKRKAEAAITREPPPGQLSIAELVKEAKPVHEYLVFDCMVRERCNCPGNAHPNTPCPNHRPHTTQGTEPQVQTHLRHAHGHTYGFPTKKEQADHKPAKRGGPREAFPKIPCVWASPNLKTGEELCTAEIEKDKMAGHIVQCHTRSTWRKCKFCDELCHTKHDYGNHLQSCEAYLDPPAYASKRARWARA